ncbi:MAG: hypothetical protein ACKN9A_16860, partial [Microcystis aeruginosa]
NIYHWVRSQLSVISYQFTEKTPHTPHPTPHTPHPTPYTLHPTSPHPTSPLPTSRSGTLLKQDLALDKVC